MPFQLLVELAKALQYLDSETTRTQKANNCEQERP
jgi:hypothetical protein